MQLFWEHFPLTHLSFSPPIPSVLWEIYVVSDFNENLCEFSEGMPIVFIV